MAFNLNAYLEEHKKLDRPDDKFAMRRPAPLIRCMDGLVLSAQAGWHAYCEPRDNNGPYVLVEVGFPTMTIIELLPYIDGKVPENIDKLLNDKFARKLFYVHQNLKQKITPLYKTHPKLYHQLTHWLFLLFKPVMQLPVNDIYAYVPVEIVESIVEDHGGLWTEERTGMEPALGQGDVVWTNSNIQNESLYTTVYGNLGSNR